MTASVPDRTRRRSASAVAHPRASSRSLLTRQASAAGPARETGDAVKVLIPGIAGALARKVAVKLVAEGHEVIGIDARSWSDAPPGIDLHAVDIRKRGAEEVFRKTRPQAVIHMATVAHLMANMEDRARLNLGGTEAVFQHCKNYGVEKCVIVGRHTYYGAGADTPLYHRETEPPQALGEFPELADLDDRPTPLLHRFHCTTGSGSACAIAK